MATEAIRTATEQVAAALDTLAATTRTATTRTATEAELLSVLLVGEGLTRKIDAISTAAIGTLDGLDDRAAGRQRAGHRCGHHGASGGKWCNRTNCVPGASGGRVPGSALTRSSTP